jgi:orotidine-5'-phosphate decarboxylase
VSPMRTTGEAHAAVPRINASDRLIVALDVRTLREAEELVDTLEGVVSFFKIGIELHVSSGVECVKKLGEARKKRIFLDLKYFDVPETVKRAVERVAAMGVSFLTIHGNGKIIRAAVEGRGKSDLKLLAVTVLTSLDSDDIKDLGFDCSVQQLVLHRARKALEAGCDGVITSPSEAHLVRDIAREAKDIKEEKFLIVTPGIRPEKVARDDHKRYNTPTEAIKAGADYLVVGRPIREAADPRKAAQKIIEEMQAAFDNLARL